MSMLRRIVAFLVALVLTGCSTKHYVVNPPQEGHETGPRYSLSDVPPDATNSDSLHIIVTLSGGALQLSVATH